MKRALAGLFGILLAVALAYSFAVISGAWRLVEQPAASGSTVTTDSLGRLAVQSPLYARLYLAKGLEEEKAGNPAAAEGLIRHAARLDPRLPEARLWLARRQLSDGRLAEAVDQLATINVITNELGPQVSALLSIAARQPQGRRLIAARVANQPLLLEVLRLSGARGATAQELLQLLSQTNLSSLPRGIETAQQTVIARDLEQRDFSSAYKNWNALLPSGRSVNAVFDGDFAGLPGSPPFAWSLKNDGSTGISGIELNLPGHATGLEIISSGSLRTIVAEQLLVLQPGTYQLRALARSPKATGQSAGYDWSLRCVAGQVITEVPIGGSSDRWAPQSWPIEVPTACPAQLLQLVSSAADFADQRSLQLTGVAAHKVR
jgi:hypothetical protein